MSAFRSSRRVEFRDTDAAGIMHFSVFFAMMEEAEHELLRKLGLSVLTADEQGRVSWPRVSARCDYRRAVKFEDTVDIHTTIARLGTKSVTYAFRFTSEDETVAEGEMVAVCCRLSDGAPPRSIEIPAWMADKLRPALASPAQPGR